VKYRSLFSLLPAVAACALFATLAAAPVHSQSNGPDYSQVSDFLNGERSLFNITDLQIASYNSQSGIWTTPITTSNSQQTTLSSFETTLTADSTQLRSFSARMFHQPQAVTITTVHASKVDAGPTSGRFIFFVQSGIPGNNNYASFNYEPLASGDDPHVTSGATANFTLDGYDDLAISFDDGRLLVATPNDRNNFQGGFRQRITTSLDVLKDMAAGDFKGDGKREIAGLTTQGVPNGGLKLVVYTVDPQSLAVTPASSLTLKTPDASTNNPITYVSMARGRFNGAGYDQLAVAFATDSGPVTVEVIGFAPNTLTPNEAPPFNWVGLTISSGSIQVKTGQFALQATPARAWSPYDQIVTSFVTQPYHPDQPAKVSRYLRSTPRASRSKFSRWG
jgi:hypothetical protein